MLTYWSSRKSGAWDLTREIIKFRMKNQNLLSALLDLALVVLGGNMLFYDMEVV